MALDERLHSELDRAAQPADPSGIYEHLIRRRERRQIARKVQSGLLVVFVLLGSVGGFYALTRIFRETEVSPPVASPTVSNGVIVFSLPLESGGEHVFAVGADGSGLRQLTPEGSAVYRSPDVSPEGRTVLVVHQIPSFEPWQSVLAVVPIEGGSPTWVTEEPWLVLDPTWSPDGERIAFAGSPGGPYGIYVLDVPTGNVELVPGTDEISVGHPTWSPDGSRIAFGASVNSADIPDERWDIFSVHLDGTQLINLTDTPDYKETWPTWSWSVDRIAFVRGGDAIPGLHSMAPDGTDEVVVTDELQDLASPTWSPDGTMLAFSADTGQIYTIGADGTELRAVTGGLGEPAWQALLDDGIPASTPTPSPTEEALPSGNRDHAVSLEGVPFPVCDLDAWTWRFSAEGIGQAFTFEQASGDVCDARVEGPQYLGITTEGGEGISRADAYFGPLTRCVEPTGCWIYASVELIDGDPLDELIVLTSGRPGGIEVWFFDVGVTDDAFAVRPYEVVCLADADCDPMMVRTIDWEVPGLNGLSCGRYAPDGSYSYSAGEFFEWTSDTGDGWTADRWRFQNGQARVLTLREEVSGGDPLEMFVPSDDGEICLQPAAVPGYVLLD